MKLSDAPEPPPKISGYECGFAALVSIFDDADRAKLAGWLANRNRRCGSRRPNVA